MGYSARRILTAVAVMAFLATPAGASAASLVYKKDANIWVASEDGSRTKQVTTDGTADSPYYGPSAQDDGTVVVGGPNKMIYVLNQDGSTKAGPWKAPVSSCSSTPLSIHAQPTGSKVVFYTFGKNVCSNSSTSPAPITLRAATDAEVPETGGPTGLNPRWLPGTNDLTGMINPYPNSIYVDDGTTAENVVWLQPGSSTDEFISFDVSRTGNRVLIEGQTNDSGPVWLKLWQNDGPPPNSAGQELCSLGGFAQDVRALPRWSPDGSQIAWSAPEGVYVSPAPVPSGGVCQLSPKLVVPGGREADWGARDLPGAATTGGAGGGADTVAPRLTLPARIGQRLGAALKSGLKLRVACSGRCKAALRVTIAKKLAKKLRLPITIARSRAIQTDGAVTLKAVFSRAAKRKLARARSLRITAVVTGADSAANVATAKKAYTLRR